MQPELESRSSPQASHWLVLPCEAGGSFYFSDEYPWHQRKTEALAPEENRSPWLDFSLWKETTGTSELSWEGWHA